MKESVIRINNKPFDLATPVVMGIMNVTPDSFYEGSRISGLEAIRHRAQQIVDEGGRMIDIGACSTRPGGDLVDAQEEMRRLRPALQLLADEFPEIPVSVDTYRADVAKMSVEEYGVAIVNDISGGMADDAMFRTVAELNVPYILMHLKGGVEGMHAVPTYTPNVETALCDYFEKKLAELRDLGAEQIILDPGYGFSKSMDDHYRLLVQQHVINERFNLPVLVGVSRKRMIQTVADCDAMHALNGTTIINTYALLHGLGDIIRVHDVREAVEAVKITQRIRRAEAECRL